MDVKAKVITVVALLLTMVIILGACSPKVQLPILREAPVFTLTNQDGREVRLSDFRDKVVVIAFIYKLAACRRNNFVIAYFSHILYNLQGYIIFLRH